MTREELAMQVYLRSVSCAKETGILVGHPEQCFAVADGFIMEALRQRDREEAAVQAANSIPFDEPTIRMVDSNKEGFQ